MEPEVPVQTGGQRAKGVMAKVTGRYPLVTVITAVFNRATSMRKCLDSIVGQDYPNIEYIVLDGGSTDGTLDVLRGCDDRIAFWKSEPDAGIYDAWNKGLSLARGEWISFLGSDDEYLPGAVTSYMELARQRPDADYLSARVRRVHPSGYSVIMGGPWQWPLFSHHMCSAHVGSMHRRRLFEAYGRFDASYRIAGDYEFLLRPGERLRSAFLPMDTARHRSGGASDSKAAYLEAARAKIATGGVRPRVAQFDLRIGLVKYRLRTGLHCILDSLGKADAPIAE
jgi:glycosyltransferase involved in cell wall biosynthesis